MTYFNAITDPTVEFGDGINLYAKIWIATFSSFIRIQSFASEVPWIDSKNLKIL